MIRTLAATAALFFTAVAGEAAAQTWGQPVYVTPHGRVVGGTPLSEVETRSYVNTGRWADGYSDQVYVHVPAPVYGDRHGYGHRRGDRGPDRTHGYDSRYGHGGYGYGPGRGYGYGRHEPRPRPGYRDVWGYNDDRHPSGRGRSHERRDRYHDRECGCGDVYLYDR